MKVAVFGLGYVGTVTAACLAANGHDVWGVDIDTTKLAMVADGRSPVVEPGLSRLISEVVGKAAMHVTRSSTKALEHSDLSLICVGTPSTPQGKTDLAHVHHVVDDIGAALRVVEPPSSGLHAVVMRSTVPPGTVAGIGEALHGALAGRHLDVGVAMCPEFLREGTGISDFYSPPYTVIGSSDDDVIRLVEQLFWFLDRPIHVVDTRSAEALKYASNAFHATKISFANEIGRLFRRLGVDSRKVMELFCEDAQLNISAKYLRPGFAFGGSCLPKDLRSMLHLARIEGVDLPMLSGTMATNILSVSEVVDRVVSGAGRTVALLGLSFKAGSDDLRESPYVDLAETFLGKGYEIRIFDTIINPSALMGANRSYVESRLPHLRKIMTETASEALRDADVAVVSSSSREVVTALLETPPPRLIDLDGGLGESVESLAGYEGVSW